MPLTMVAFKIDNKQAEAFQNACGKYGLNKSKFLRACVEKFTGGNEAEQESFLELLGFKKKVSWTRE